jgi:hypothetical protein
MRLMAAVILRIRNLECYRLWDIMRRRWLDSRLDLPVASDRDDVFTGLHKSTFTDASLSRCRVS